MKKYLSGEFDINNLGAAKQILGMSVARDSITSMF